MFKRSKKKAAQPVSRASHYMLSESVEGPEFDGPDLSADPDFFTSTYLRQGLNSDSSNAENESISSSGNSEDGTCGKKKQKKKGLTFSTFLGTPRLSRRNQGDSDDSRSSRNFEKDTSSLSSREDVPDFKQSKESVDQDVPIIKKQSVMSKFKQALNVPKSTKKGLKDLNITQPPLRGKGKPPPPPPKRISSLTRQGWETEDIEDIKPQVYVSERSTSMYDIKASALSDSVFQSPTEKEKAEQDSLSLDVNTISLNMSENPAEFEIEKCDTLQSVEDLSDEEVSGSISSALSHPQVSLSLGTSDMEIPTQNESNMEQKKMAPTRLSPTHAKVEKSNAIKNELNFYLDKIKEKSKSLRKDDNDSKPLDHSIYDSKKDTKIVLPPKTPFNSMLEEGLSKLDSDSLALEPEDSIFINNITYEDESTSEAINGMKFTKGVDQSMEMTAADKQKLGETSISMLESIGERSVLNESYRMACTPALEDSSPLPYGGKRFSTFAHSPEKPKQTKIHGANLGSPSEPSSEADVPGKRLITSPANQTNKGTNESLDRETLQINAEPNSDLLNSSQSSISSDTATPIAPPRKRRSPRKGEEKSCSLTQENSLITTEEIKINEKSKLTEPNICEVDKSSPSKMTQAYTKVTNSATKPPVSPKPSWIKDALKGGDTDADLHMYTKEGKDNESTDTKEYKDPKGKISNNLESNKKLNGNSECGDKMQIPTIPPSSSSSCNSDTDTLSSSSFDSKPTPRVVSKMRRLEKVCHDDTTDEDVVTLKPSSKPALSTRCTTPTIDLYNIVSGSGPIARSLPSPCPDSQPSILVEDDYPAESEKRKSYSKQKSPQVRAPRKMIKSSSVPRNLSLGVVDSFNQMQPKEEMKQSVHGSRTPELYTRPRSPIHHSRSVDMDIDISSEILSPGSREGEVSELMDIRARAVTPSIEQIRSFQKSRSAQNEILVENLRYRPSTPLIGGSSIDLSENYARNKEMFKKRLSTPAFSTRGLSSMELSEHSFTNPVEISGIEPPKQAMTPLKSHPLNMYKSGFASDTERMNTPRNVSDQWTIPTDNSVPDMRPPTPVLRARVNSVLDNLMARPIGPPVNRSPLVRSQSVDKLLNNSSLLLPASILDDYPSPRVYDRNSRPATPSYPLRPSSPFQIPFSRGGYYDRDIDVQFPTPPHWISSQKAQSNMLGSMQAGRSASNPQLTPQVHQFIVPPLNLDFIHQKAVDDELYHINSANVPYIMKDQIPINMIEPTSADSTPTMYNQRTRVTSQQNLQSAVVNISPNYSEQQNYKIKRGSRQEEESVDSILREDVLDVSTACLELSNPVSSDSETENDLTSSPRNGWKNKSMEIWTTSDVVDWCYVNTYYQTALLFKGTNLTGADLHLISDRHLVELGLNDEQERQEFMSEVEKLRLKPRSAASLWRLKQTSMKRRNLEASSELLKERLYNLQQMSSHQNERIDTSMEEVIQQQKQADELLGTPVAAPQDAVVEKIEYKAKPGNNPGVVADLHTDVPLIKWTREDVTAWLKASELDRFIEQFREYNVTGKVLAAVDMQLLDKLGIDSTEDRELFLSKLYDLQRPIPESSQDEMIGSQGILAQGSSPSDQLTDRGSTSIGKSNGENQAMDIPGDYTNVKTVNGHNKHTSLQNKFKEIVSPRKFVARHKEMDIIRIWHDISGTSMSTEVKISESTTSEDIVIKVLQDLEITDDINLFFLTVSSPNTEEGEKELGKFECPLSVQRSSQGGNARFDLRRRLGITIKVICQVSNMKPRGKGFRVSAFSTCAEVLLVALRKFGMCHVDPSLFCLLPINKDTGDVRMMNGHEVIQDCESDAFILSNHDNTEQLLATSESLPLVQQGNQILRRNSSLNSHGSSGLSQSSETSQGSDSGKPRNEKLETLEAMMADIEASLSARIIEEELQKAEMMPAPSTVQPRPVSSPRGYNHQTDYVPHLPAQFNISRYVTPRKQKLPSSDKYVPHELRSDEHLEMMREIALMRESVQERDRTISNLKLQIDNFKSHSNEVEDLKSQLYETKTRQKEAEEHWQEQLTSARKALEVKQHQLENAAQALQAEQRKIHLNDDDDSDSGRETNRSARGSAPGSTTDLSLDIDQLERELEVIQLDVRAQEEQLIEVRARRQKAVEESRVTGDTINVQLLGEDCTIVEAKLLKAKQKHAEIYAKLELTKREQTRSRQTLAPVPSLSEVLTPGGNMECIMCLELANTEGHGFIHGRDSHHRLIIKHVAQGHPLQKSDRILEVNGQRVFHLEDQEFTQVLRQVKTPMKVIIVRDASNSRSVRHTDEDLEAMKEDFAMAMMEVESAQQENQDLNEEVQRLKDTSRDLHEDNRRLREEVMSLKKEMEEKVALEEDKLKSSLLQPYGNDHSAQKKTRFKDDFCSGSTDSEIGRLPQSSNESEAEEVIAYHLLDENIPLWESLKTASKKEILQVLKDHILETSQQKNYLDQLMSVVIDNAPTLLEHMDSETDLITSLCWKSQSEEFC